jgi:hypothetical protein
MSSLPILQSLKESIVTANVKAVYGEPIAAQGKTVIPDNSGDNIHAVFLQSLKKTLPM